MRSFPYLFAAIAVGAGNLAAQEFIGFSYNGQVSFTSRGFLGFGAVAGEIMNRIDGGDYAGWGTDTPGTRTITSLFFIVQDQNAVATPEVFSIKLYPESTTTPGFPDLTAGVTFATGVTGPPAPPSGVVSAAVKVVTPAAPVSVPIQGGGDVFVSWVLPPSPTASTADGLSIQALDGNAASTSVVKDVPGPRKFPQGNNPATSNGVTLTPPSTLQYSVAREWLFDVAHNGTGGVVMTITNQTTLTGSNNPPPAGFGPAPGTASFLSGTSPDANGFNAGRADDITFDYFKTGFGTGGLVAFLRDTDFSSAFGPEIQVSTFFPGSSGVSCLVNFEIIGFGFTAADEAFLTTTIPPAIRPILAGLTAKHQAAGIDAGGNFIVSPCGAQHF